MIRPPGDPLRVSVVSAFGVLGGAERWLLRLLDATDRLAVDAVLLGEGPLRAELERRGIGVTALPTGRRPAELATAALRLAARLRAAPPEVVLANGVKSAVVAAPAARIAGIPVVWAKHDHSYDGWLAAPLARACDRVVAAVEELAEATGRRDTVVIPPPRPDDPPAPRAEARAFWAREGIDLDGGPVVAMVGRLAAGKGIDDAIESLADPAAAVWRLIVVGPDDPTVPGERERLRALAAARGVADRVHLAGGVPDAARWLAAFDAVAVLTKAMPGGFGHEGFGTSAFEAMLAGVPVIAAEGGAVSRRLAGGAGIVVDPGDPRGIAAALGTLADAGARERASAAARRGVADHPTAGPLASRLAGVLAESARRPGAAVRGSVPVSVVATVLNEGPRVEELLAALVPQLAPADEIVIVDGGSDDDTVPRAKRWAADDERVRVLERPGTNISEGRNAGVTEAAHETIACTDAGCVPDPGWLAAIRAPFAEAEAPDLVAGVVRVAPGGVLQDAMTVAGYADPDEARRPDLLSRAYGSLLGRTFDPAMPYGRSMAFTRSAWKRAGGFPEHLETAEDPEFGRAIVGSGGHAVLQAHAEVTWAPRPTAGATARMYFRYGVGDGMSGSRTLVGRNLARIAAYAGGPLLLARGGRAGRALAAAGAAIYLSLPVRRALRHRRGVRVAAATPLALALKDLAKAAGCLAGLMRRR